MYIIYTHAHDSIRINTRRFWPSFGWQNSPPALGGEWCPSQDAQRSKWRYLEILGRSAAWLIPKKEWARVDVEKQMKQHRNSVEPRVSTGCHEDMLRHASFQGFKCELTWISPQFWRCDVDVYHWPGRCKPAHQHLSIWWSGDITKGVSTCWWTSHENHGIHYLENFPRRFLGFSRQGFIFLRKMMINHWRLSQNFPSQPQNHIQSVKSPDFPKISFQGHLNLTISGWWLQHAATTMKNMKVSCDYFSQCMQENVPNHHFHH